MNRSIICLLAVLCGSAALLGAVAEALNSVVQFVAARTGSAVAPPEFLAQPGASERSCGFMCSLRSGCFGFYWLLGECRLFDLQAFFNASACNQSSTEGERSCSRAIDGNTNGTMDFGSCSNTKLDGTEWWEAVLAAPSIVSYVTIYNRQDCCAENLNKFDLIVDGSVCQQVNLTVPFAEANFSCNAFGSQVRIVSRSDPPKSLTICEFIAYRF